MLESDSIEAISMVLDLGGGGNPDHQVIVQSCKGLMALEWSIEIKHVLKEANRAADWTTRWAARQETGVFELTELLSALELISGGG